MNIRLCCKIGLLASLITLYASKSAMADSHAFLGPGWTVIGGKTRVEVRRDSIKHEGSFVTSEFAYFYFDSVTKNLYMSAKGKRKDNCSSYKYSVDNINVSSATIYNQFYGDSVKKEVYLDSSKNDSNDFYFSILQPYHSAMLHRYLCNDIRPSFLKVGMNAIDAVNKLKANGYNTVEQYPGAVQHNDKKLCETDKPCIVCGNGFSGCYIEMKNVTGSKIELRIDYADDTLIDTKVY